MYCNNCGNKIPDGAKFCCGCGAAVNASSTASSSRAAAPKSTTPAYVPPTNVPVANTSASSVSSGSAAPRGFHVGLALSKTLLVIVGIVSCLWGALVLVYGCMIPSYEYEFMANGLMFAGVMDISLGIFSLLVAKDATKAKQLFIFTIVCLLVGVIETFLAKANITRSDLLYTFFLFLWVGIVLYVVICFVSNAIKVKA